MIGPNAFTLVPRPRNKRPMSASLSWSERDSQNKNINSNDEMVVDTWCASYSRNMVIRSKKRVKWRHEQQQGESKMLAVAQSCAAGSCRTMTAERSTAAPLPWHFPPCNIDDEPPIAIEHRHAFTLEEEEEQKNTSTSNCFDVTSMMMAIESCSDQYNSKCNMYKRKVLQQDIAIISPRDQGQMKHDEESPEKPTCAETSLSSIYKSMELYYDTSEQGDDAQSKSGTSLFSSDDDLMLLDDSNEGAESYQCGDDGSSTISRKGDDLGSTIILFSEISFKAKKRRPIVPATPNALVTASSSSGNSERHLKGNGVHNNREITFEVNKEVNKKIP